MDNIIYFHIMIVRQHRINIHSISTKVVLKVPVQSMSLSKGTELLNSTG